MTLDSTISGIVSSVASYFTGGGSSIPYQVPTTLQPFLNSFSELQTMQGNWCLNPGYSFSVITESSPNTPYNKQLTGSSSSSTSIPSPVGNFVGVTPGAGGSASGVTFQNFPLSINPSNISVKEPFANDILPTQTGIVINHSGGVLKYITISGTTGIQPFRGPGGVINTPAINALAGQIGLSQNNFPMALFTSGVGALNGTPSGFMQFHMLNNYIRAYEQIKTIPQCSDARLVFMNQKDGENWIVEVMEFDLMRDAKNPILYNYNIVLAAFKLIAINKQPVTGAVAVLNTLQNIISASTELITTGTQLINASSGYISSILQSFQSTIIAPLNALTGLLDAANSFGTAIPTEAKQNIININNSVQSLQNAIADNTGGGSSQYNAIYGRNPVFTVAATQVPPQQAVQAYQGIAMVQSGLKILLATNLPYATPIPNTTISPLIATNQSNVSVATTALTASGYTTAGVENMFGNQIPLIQANSAVPYIIQTGDTLEIIALKTLGNTDQWVTIALLNALKYPYIENVADPANNTVGVGSTILIPSTASAAATLTLDNVKNSYITQGFTPLQLSFGVDVALDHNNDWQVDQNGDFNLSAGYQNAAQAVEIALLLQKGSLKQHPYKGVGLMTGDPSNQSPAEILTDIRSSILTDPRFSAVTNLYVGVNGPKIDLNLTVTPSALGSPVPITIPLTPIQ